MTATPRGDGRRDTPPPASPPPPGLVGAIRAIDAVAEWSGRVIGWLIVPMTLGIAYEVIARRFFGAPTIWVFDTTYMLYGTHFMLGAAYTLLKSGHVRTDMFFHTWSPRTQSLVDAIGYLCFFFPGMVFVLIFGWQEAWHAWEIGERSDASPWRPIIYPFKAVIPLAALLLLVQGISEFLKSLHGLRTGRHYTERQALEL